MLNGVNSGEDSGDGVDVEHIFQGYIGMEVGAIAAAQQQDRRNAGAGPAGITFIGVF